MIRENDVESVFPLSPLQEGMLFETLRAEDDALYVVQCHYELRGQLSVPALVEAWKCLMERHAVLRTGFAWKQVSKPWQVVLRNIGVPLHQEDWRELSQTEQHCRLEAYLKEDRQTQFVLSEAPLFRIALLRTRDDAFEALVTFHHIIMDAWSCDLLWKEMWLQYRGKQKGEKVELPAPTPYRIYIEWLQTQRSGTEEMHWRQYLKGFTSPTILPFKHRESDRVLPEKREQTKILSGALTEQLRIVGRQHRLTMNTVLQGAWALLLAMYSGERDVVFGTTISGRPVELEGCDTTIGLFINTLPVRVQIEWEELLGEWMRTLQARQAQCYEYGYTPLARIRDWSDLGNATPLFETIVIFENYRRDAFEASFRGASKPDREAIEVISKGTFDRAGKLLSVNAGLVQDRLAFVVSYEEHRYHDDEITRIVQQLENVLANISEYSGRHLLELDRLSETEHRQLLKQGSGREELPTNRQTLPVRYVLQALNTPDAIAAIHENHYLSYRELERRSKDLAVYLYGLGIGPEVRVAVLVERSLELLVAILGITRAGAAYVPLDPQYPDARLEFMLQDTQAVAVVSTNRLASRIAASVPYCVRLDEEYAENQLNSNGQELPQIHADSLAYVLYTSGSTGRPKGAMISHRGLSNYLDWCTLEYDANSGSGTPLHSSIGFDLSVTALFAPLMVGGCVRLALHGPLVQGLTDLCQEESDFSFIKVTPSQTRLLAGTLAPERVGDVTRRIVIGGEALSWSDVLFWQQHAPETVIVNEYGPTETVVGCCTYTLHWAEMESTSVPIGRPIANTNAYVLNEWMNLLPRGATGELYIGGEGVGRGYINRPDLTAERFIPNPFSTQAGQRLYRTGDLARWNTKENLEFLGRADAQLKIRGYRVEPGEVEAVLAEYVGVREAVVIRDTDQESLLAYIVAENPVPAADSLRSHLQRVLPPHMVPREIIFLESLPLTSNGKLDRKALPKMGNTQVISKEPRKPYTQTEEILAGIWQQLLRVTTVQTDDDFFALGGHSLLATQLVSRIRHALNVDLPIAKVFESSTIAGLARQVEEARRQGRQRKIPPILQAKPQTEFPLSYAQQRLWFLDQLEPDSPAYNLPCALYMEGEFDRGALLRSIREMVRRHDILRARLTMKNGIAVQRIATEPVTVSLVDLQALHGRLKIARTVAEQEGLRGFNLSQDPLLRVQLIELGESEHVLVMTMHHIISDGWSVGIMVRELTALYEAYREGKEPGLKQLEIQYQDYAVWQREWLKGELAEEELGYWRAQLEGLQSLELPADYPQFGRETRRAGTAIFHIEEETLKKLEHVSRNEGITLFMSLLACLHLVLGRWAGQDDVAVGTPVANRTHLETEGLIGFFVNTLVLRTRWETNPTVREFLRQVRRIVLGAFDHQELPFEKLVGELEPERQLDRMPLFQVMLVMQNVPTEQLRMDNLNLQGLGFKTAVPKFDLSLELQNHDNRLTGTAEYNAERFTASTIDRIVNDLSRMLEKITSDLEKRVADIDLLSEPERQQLLLDLNATDVPFPTEPIHQLFALQAERTPDAIAVVFNDHSLSYWQLHLRSSYLAHSLCQQGVLPETPVAICLQRSLEIIISMLSILKAGGAYIPLDPDYPANRLEFMLRDSRARLVLTDKALAAKLPNGYQTICVEQKSAGQQQNIDLPVRIDADTLAYAMYTSGSTGQPKAVMIPHKGIARLVFNCNDIELSAEQVILQMCPCTFDVATFEIWGALLRGGKLVLPPATQPSLEEIGEAIRTYGISLLWLTAPLFHAMVNERVSDLLPVQQVLAGGDVVSARCATQFLESSVESSLTNGYGPTEATAFATFHRMRTAQQVGWTTPIGKPISNTKVYVLDSRMNLSGFEALGELYIAGPGIARGYLARPDLTAERFVPNPFSKEPGERMYRTGDRVRWRSQGHLEFLGRLDQQVKVRGNRVETGEVEAVLKGHPDVREVAVVAADANGHQRLLAYVVTKEGVNLEDQVLRRYLQQWLPPYMVPGMFIQLQEIPLLNSGKLNRRALPVPELSGKQKCVAPRTKQEEILAKVWRQVLRAPNIGIHDNFFALGGDSILSLQIVTRARQAGLQFAVRDIFQNQTIAALAQAAKSAWTIEAEQGEVRGPVVLTPVQKYFLEREITRPSHFNQTVFLHASQELDVVLLNRVFEELMRHHDALRMSFHYNGREWKQKNEAWKAGECGFTCIDFREVRGQNPRRELIERVAATAQGSLDLQTGRLTRSVYFHLGEEGGRLLLVVHHLVVDGVSWRILLEDMQNVYKQLQASSSAVLPAKASSFQRWAEGLQEYALRPDVQAERAYWLEVEGQGTSVLPKDFPDGQNTVVSEDTFSVELKREETDMLLQELPRRRQVKIQEVLLAALVHALGQWSGRSKWKIAMEGHGREAIMEKLDISRTVGWFTTIYPVLLGGEGGEEGWAGVEQVQTQLAAVPKHGIGYGVLRYLGMREGEKALGAARAPEISFNYLGQFDRVLESGGALRAAQEASGPWRHPGGLREYVLEISGSVVGGQLRMYFTYSTQLHRQQTIQSLAESFLVRIKRTITSIMSTEPGTIDFSLAGLDSEELETLFD